MPFHFKKEFINQSIDQSTNQSIDRSINQSINQSIKCWKPQQFFKNFEIKMENFENCFYNTLKYFIHSCSRMIVLNKIYMKFKRLKGWKTSSFLEFEICKELTCTSPDPTRTPVKWTSPLCRGRGPVVTSTTGPHWRPTESPASALLRADRPPWHFRPPSRTTPNPPVVSWNSAPTAAPSALRTIAPSPARLWPHTGTPPRRPAGPRESPIALRQFENGQCPRWEFSHSPWGRRFCTSDSAQRAGRMPHRTKWRRGPGRRFARTGARWIGIWRWLRGGARRTRCLGCWTPSIRRGRRRRFVRGECGGRDFLCVMWSRPAWLRWLCRGASRCNEAPDFNEQLHLFWVWFSFLSWTLWANIFCPKFSVIGKLFSAVWKTEKKIFKKRLDFNESLEITSANNRKMFSFPRVGWFSWLSAYALLPSFLVVLWIKYRGLVIQVWTLDVSAFFANTAPSIGHLTLQQRSTRSLFSFSKVVFSVNWKMPRAIDSEFREWILSLQYLSSMGQNIDHREFRKTSRSDMTWLFIDDENCEEKSFRKSFWQKNS